MEICLSTMLNNSAGTVKVRFTIGFGNNIFQYVFARLLAEHHGCQLQHPYFPGFDIQEKIPLNRNPNLKQTLVRQEEYKTGVYAKYFSYRDSSCNYNVHGFFEDYTIYKNNLNKIISWFYPVKKQKKRNLVVHLRLQNRLIQVNHYLNLIEPNSYRELLKQFDFDELHIVTDLEKWENFTPFDIFKIRKDVLLGPNPGPKWVKTKDSVDYINTLIDMFSEYEPIVHCSDSKTIPNTGGLRGGFMEAFDFLRSFDQIILQNSTFSWWAAVLGGASKVAVFSLWKPGREIDCPNLGQTDYEGWFGWGSKSDLISNREESKKYQISTWRKMKKRSTLINYAFKPLRFLLNRGRWSTDKYK